MFSMGTVTSVVGVVALLVVALVKRRADVGDLGSVSNRWIAKDRVD